MEQFRIDWEAQQVECPQGQMSSSWAPAVERGKELIKVKFTSAVCGKCAVREKCTDSRRAVRRTLTLKPYALHEALRQGRQRERTAEYKAEYQKRSGIEGTISQGVRAFGLRQSRYIGLAKTHLAQVLTAIAINLVRWDNWLQGVALAQTRQAAFVRVLAPA